MPAVAIVTEPFVGIARSQARVLGLEAARIVTIQHPLDGLEPSGVRQRAQAVVDAVLRSLRE